MNVHAANIRLVTLCGSAAAKSDAIRDYQDIIEPLLLEQGIASFPVDIGSWSVRSVPSIVNKIRLQQPDLILMQYPTAAFGASLGPIAISAIQRVAPLVVMLHEFVAAHPLRKIAIGALLARADLVGVTAEREAQIIARWYPWLRRRLRRIPIASNIPRRDWAPSSPPVVTYFGQLRPEKGLEDFFLCQRSISAAYPEARFRIVGAIVPRWTSYAQTVQNIASERGIELSLGAESQDVADVLATASVALLPFPGGASFRRGSLFAAAGCGLPVVTRIGDDTPEELASLLDPARNVDELVALTLHYLRNETSRLEAHRRSRRLSDMFGWNQTISCYLQSFSELLPQRPN